MPYYLGIDTSNYTTSAALYDSSADRVFSAKKLLPVALGEAGLRQSDAVFAHVKQLPQVVQELIQQAADSSAEYGQVVSSKTFRDSIGAVCASAWPRRVEGSYMPAFLVGMGSASILASMLGTACYECSHQEGHIVAALHSAGVMDWLGREFYAFHVSGGTTECLLVRPQNENGQPPFSLELVAKTLDLNAGQLVDRVGVLLGLPFPCGGKLDKLAMDCKSEFLPPRQKPAFQGTDCHFSGAQNRCETLFQTGAPPEAVARCAVEYVCAAVDGMTARVMKAYGGKPILYAGGVMSNSLARERLHTAYGGVFAAPEFSSDNASGSAILASIFDKGHA